MNKSKKVVIKLIVVLLVLLVGLGGTFAYAYLATDLLRSDKELFFKYLSQINSEENSFIDANIVKFQEKKKQHIHENSGQFTVDVEIPDEVKATSGNLFDKVNELVIRFSGKANPISKKVEQNIEIDYGNDVIFPINYLQDGEKIGLQTDFVGKKYIAVENNELDELAGKTGMENEEIPNKIKIEELIKKLELTPEESEQVKQTYMNILNQQLAKENFAKVKTEQGMSYTLTLTGEQLKNLAINLLETFKQDTILLKKINKFMLEIIQDGEYTGIDENAIQKTIDDLQKQDVSEMKDVKITVSQNNKLLNQIIIEYDTNLISITKNATNEQLTYSINIQNETIETALDTQEESTTKLNIYLNLTYNGLQNLDNIQENYDIGLIFDIDEKTMSYKYNFNNLTKFTEMAKIDTLSEENAIILNNYDSQVIQNLMNKIGERLVQVNEMQMQKLGLEAEQNPLMYSNPITPLVVSASEIVSMANKAMLKNTEANVIENMNFAYILIKTEIASQKSMSSDYNGTAHIEEYVKKINKDLGGTEQQAPERYVVEADLNNNTIAIKYEDENFGRGKYQPIVGTITITNDNATFVEPKSQIE